MFHNIIQHEHLRNIVVVSDVADGVNPHAKQTKLLINKLYTQFYKTLRYTKKKFIYNELRGHHSKYSSLHANKIRNKFLIIPK